MKRILADIIFITHFALVAFVLLGWLIPEVWPLYMLVIITTLVSEVIFGYCPLSKFEFDARKKINPSIDYNYSFASYYTHKLTDKYLSERFVSSASYVLLSSLIIINTYFHYFHE